MMASSAGLYDDVALKPKLLRSLLREYVPDEKHPFTNPSELSYVVSTIKTHKLLSELNPQSVEQESVDAWKSAVDSWVHRLLTLCRSNSADKCWAGICLLGLTCQECCSQRFLSSYFDWLDMLLLHLKPPAVSHVVKTASCASLSDMFTRLSVFTNVMKDGTSQAAKVLEPVLKLLNEESSAFVLEEAVNLLCTMINFFPFSVQRHYDSFEAVIFSNLMSGKCYASTLKKLGYGLSLLPKSKGDAVTWSLMMEKILLCLNSQLKEALQGIEEEAKSYELIRALAPSDKQLPSPLGGSSASLQALDSSAGRPEQLLMSRISTLMQCSSNMLKMPYPIMVSVPVRALISLAERVLMIDDSLLSSSFSFMTIYKQEFICSEIPLLQLHGLEILAAVIKGLSSQLLPYAPAIIKLLNEYLRGCQFPNLRIKAYALLKDLLISMGVGIAIHISQEVFSHVLYDLDHFGSDKNSEHSGLRTKIHAESVNDSHQKKRKHSSSVQSQNEQSALSSVDAEVLHVPPIPVKIAALETLEALLTVGTFMRSEIIHQSVDSLLIAVAENACKVAWSMDGKKKLVGDLTHWVGFQVAALRALHASFLSPGRRRPSHLARGLELFRRGALETSTKTVAEYCGHTLLTLEVLIHPRSLPVFDLEPNVDHEIESHKFQNALYSSRNIQFHSGRVANGSDEAESEDDDLNLNWPGKDEEMEIEVDDTRSLEKGICAKDGADVTKSHEDIEMRKLGGYDDENRGNAMDESPNFIVKQKDINQGTEVHDRIGFQHGVDASLSAELESPNKRIASMENDILLKNEVNSDVHERMLSTSEQDDMEASKTETVDALESKYATISDTERNRELITGSDIESDDSLPDIVDGDPDSD